MRNTLFIILSVLFIALFAITCSSGFNPRYYYQQMANGDSGGGDTEEPDIGGEDILKPEEDPFYNYNGERPWNEENYGGFTLNLHDDYVIAASFGLKNEPRYMLIKDDKWKLKDSSRNEYFYNGTNTKAAGFTVTKVKYYMYENMNPTFSSTSAYNKSERLKRFWFYRFTGTAGLETDNYLIAIDRYSKLVFAFAIPVKWKTIVGIPAPMEWGSVELGWEASADSANLNSQIKFAVDGITYFYEYDPVGIVLPNGDIKIYKWCSDSIANNNRYAPRVYGGKIDLGRPIANENIEDGRSPYMPIKIVEKNKMALQVQNLEIENISAKTLNTKFGGKTEYYDYAGFSYDIRFAGSLNTEEPVLNTVASKEKPSLFFDSLTTVNIGERKSLISTVYTADIQYEDKDEVYFSLDAAVTMYDKTYKIPQIVGDVILIEHQKPMIKFKYDKTQDMFVFDSSVGDTANISYDKSFTLKKGEIKEFIITIKNDTIGADETAGEIKLIYTLSY